MALPPADGIASPVCDAIRDLRVLEFTYNEKPRTVAPYCHGATANIADVLRAVQVGGAGSGYGFGKLWDLALVRGLRVTKRTFVPDDPDYNPDDSAMVRIHCRVQPAAPRAHLRLIAGGRSGS